jgi:hypothetical protein
MFETTLLGILFIGFGFIFIGLSCISVNLADIYKELVKLVQVIESKEQK